jgi:hypothetical protein
MLWLPFLRWNSAETAGITHQMNTSLRQLETDKWAPCKHAYSNGLQRNIKVPSDIHVGFFWVTKPCNKVQPTASFFSEFFQNAFYQSCLATDQCHSLKYQRLSAAENRKFSETLRFKNWKIDNYVFSLATSIRAGWPGVRFPLWERDFFSS